MSLQVQSNKLLIKGDGALMNDCCCGCVVVSGMLYYLRNQDFTGAGIWPDSQGNFDATNNGVTLSGGFPLFDGISNYLDMGQIPTLEGLNAYSFSVWYNNTVTSTGINGAYLFSYNTAPASSPNSCAVWYDAAIGPNFILTPSGSPPNRDTLVPFDPIPHNQWHQIVIVVDSPISIKIYSDGVLVNTLPVVGSFLGGAGFHMFFGESNELPFDGYFGGSITEIMAYTKALNDAEVLQNYNCQKTIFGL